LLDWYRDQYIQDNPDKWARGRNPRLYPTGEAGWKLTMTERKRILLDHIYGVDIDPQAVEVTKLSLLLRVLEDEKSLSPQLELIQTRVLPDLGDNIKCGNSLIGPDFYSSGQQLALFDEEEMQRVNAFDWEAEFPAIMRAGGFDAVIGNPPYIRIQAMKEWAPLEVEFYKQKYIAASKGNYDIYVVFVEKGLSLLSEQGYLGFILPHKFFNAHYGEPLRDLLAQGKYLNQLIHFGHQQVFVNATTYTCLLFLNKQATDKFHFVSVKDLAAWQRGEKQSEGVIEIGSDGHSQWNFTVGSGVNLIHKLNALPVKLADVTNRIFQGIKTGADKIFIVEEIERQQNQVRIFSPEKGAEYWLEADLLHPLVKGGDSKRFNLTRTNRLIIFPYEQQSDNSVKPILTSDFEHKYPLTWKYLLDNKSYLENRERGKMRGTTWFVYTRNQALDVISQPKIFTPDIAPHSIFSLDDSGEAFFTGGVAGGYGILVSPEFSREYILGLLNSKLLEWFVHQTATQMRGGWYSYEARFIRHLPIRPIDFTNPADKARHDRMVDLVEQMLNLHQRLAAESVPQTRTVLQRQIEATDRQIDLLVYELYGLTEEEIKIVEGRG
jgi:hypothetical protein